MRAWSTYIQAVDQNIDDTVLNLRGWSFLVGLIPLVLFGIFDLFFQPEGAARTLPLMLAIGVAVSLWGVWLWRILVIVFGNRHG